MMLEIEKPRKDTLESLDHLVKIKILKSQNLTITLSKKIFEEYQFNQAILECLVEILCNKLSKYLSKNENKVKKQAEKEIKEIRNENKHLSSNFSYISMALENVEKK